MKSALTAARLLPILAAWATLPFAAPLHGAEFSLPFTEDFQSSSFLDSAKTTARWTSGGVTLGHARGRHMEDLGSMPRDRRIGNSLSTSAINDIAVRDMNGDSRLDVLIANDDGVFAYLVGEVGGLGTIQPVEVTTAGAVTAMAVGDFDRDGDLDVVAAAAGDRNEVVFYGNEGNGHAFRKHSQVSDLSIVALVSADMDGDGDLDLVLAREGRGVEVHLNDGRGNFRLKENAVSAPRNRNKTLEVGDLDGDGDMDIVLAQVRGVNVFHLNRGNAVFEPHQTLHRTGSAVDYRSIAIGDVNNDGHMDILVGVRQGQNILYLNNGGGVFGAGSRINDSSARTIGVELADMDGDGDMDIVEGAAKRGTRIYLNQGGAFASGPAIDGKTNAIAVGDVDGDGHPGLIIGESPASLKVLRLEERPADGPATTRFDNARSRVVSRRIDIDGQVPHVVYFTATAAPSTNTGIDYYLSNDDGNHWRRAYPGRIVRFLSQGNRLRWRAELRSRSPALSTTLTQIGVEGVLQVSIDDLVQQSGSNDPYRASSQTVGKEVRAVLKLENRSDRPLETSIRFTGEGFRVENEPDGAIPPGSSYSADLIFEPTKWGIHPSELTISSTESGIALHQFDLALRGEGFAAEMQLSRRDSEARVGSSATQIVEVKNRGNLDLEIDHPPTISTSRFVLLDPDPSSGFPLTVSASKSVNLGFRFKPEARGTVTGSVTFVSNAIGTTETITLRGKGLASEIDFFINSTTMSQVGFLYHFNDWPVNETTSARVDITNLNGDASLQVEPLASIENPHFSREVIKAFPLVVDEFGTEESVLTLNFRPKNHGPQTATVVFASNAINDPQTITLTGRGLGSEMELRVGDKILAEGATHTFIAAKVNTSMTVTVQVHNHGNVPMNISTPTLAKVGGLEGFSLVESGGLPDTVPEEGFESFTFRFQPTMPGTATALVTFTSNAINATRTTIVLQGRGTAPMISVTPTGTIQFGDVPARTTTDRHVKITNTGDATLEVTSATVVNGGAAEALFSVVSPAQFPHPVGAGEELTLTVRFSPLEPMDSNVRGVLEIKSDAFNTLEKHPQVSGQGVASMMAIVITGTNVNVGDVPVADSTVPLHDFGDVPINTSASRRVIIFNQRGGAQLRVEIPSFGEAGPFRWQNDPVPEVVVVKADKSTSSLILVFEPEEPGPQVTTLTFVSDAFENATQTVTLKGRGRGKPRMEVTIDNVVRQHEGAPYQFGSQAVGTMESVEVTISNNGNDDLMIEYIGTTANTLAPLVRHTEYFRGRLANLARQHPSASERYRPGYSISDNLSRTIIEAGSSATVMLRFSPSMPSREDNALLTLKSNDPEHPDWALDLKGSGTGPMLSAPFFASELGYQKTDEPATFFHDMGEAIFYDKRPTPVETRAQPFAYAAPDTKFSRPQPRNGQHRYWLMHNWGNENMRITYLDMEEAGTGFRIYEHGNRQVRSLVPNQYIGGGVVFTPVRRGVHTGTFVIRSNDVNLPEFRVLFTGRGFAPGIDVQTGGFGDVSVGGSSTARVVVRNDGDAPLTISGVEVDDSGQFSANVVFSDFPVVLTGTDSRFVFDVSFVPAELGISTAALIVLSDALRESAYPVELQGNGVEPETKFGVQVDGQVMGAQTSFDFRRVRVGMTTAVTVAVENKGSSALNIEPLLSGDDDYSLANSGARIITPNSSGSWVLRFHPENSRPYDGVLNIVNANNHSESFRRLNLAGLGVKSGIQVKIADTVYQSETGSYNFGKIGYGTSSTAEVTITNTGDAALNIKSIGVTPDQLEYSIHYGWNYGQTSTRYRKMDTGYSLADSGIRMIPADSSASFTLHFTPVIPVSNNGVLRIVSDDPEQPEWNLDLTGSGTGPFLDVSIYVERHIPPDGHYRMSDTYLGESGESPSFLYMNVGDSDLRRTKPAKLTGEGLGRKRDFFSTLRPGHSIASASWFWLTPTRRGVHTGTYTIYTNDKINPEYTVHLLANAIGPGIDVAVNSSAVVSGGEHHFGDVPVGDPLQAQVTIDNDGDSPVALEISDIVVDGGNGQFDKKADLSLSYPVVIPHEADPWLFHVSFTPTGAGPASARLVIRNNAYREKTYTITLRGNGVVAPSAWADGAQRPAVPTFVPLESDISAPRFVGLGYADWQSRLWLAFDEPAQILSGTDARALADGAALSGFKVLANYTGGGAVEDIGVLRARYRSGGVVMDLARGIVPADASVWARYTPPSDGVSGIYDMAVPPNRISTTRLFMLPRSAVLDYDGDGFPDALEARLGGNPLVAGDMVGLPEVALLRAGAAGSPAAVAYSGIRADGVAAHLGVVTTGASSLAAYYLSDTFGYSGGYALGVDSYGCTGRFPSDYASPLSEGGCAVVDFNNIRAGVEHRIGWLATNAAGYWAVAQGTASRLPEQVILRVPEFNMKRRNVFVANSAAADAAVRVSAFHDGLASLSPLTVSLSNVAAADSPSSKEPDDFSVSVADVTTDTTSYAITGVHSGEDSKLWLAGDPLSSLTPDKYSLGKVTQTDVVRLGDDSLPPLFGRASLYEGSTASENERHAVVVRGTENYIALLPVVHGTAQTASAFEVSPWDGAGGGPVAVDDRILAVSAVSPVADGALVRIAFTASNPPATVRNTVSLEVAASSAGASTATTVLTWPVIDSADALASIAGDGDNDGIPDARDSYRMLNRLPISVAGGVSGYPDRSSAGADGWHHIRPLSPLHSQHVGSYAMRAGLSFQTGFSGDGLILARLYITTPEQQTPLAADYQPGIPIQMNYADFAASLSRDEFGAMARQSRQDIAVVYNFRLHGVEPSVAQDTSLAGGRAGVVIPLPESLRETTNILPLHYTNGAWSGFSTESDTPATAGFAPLQAGVCPDDNGLADSPYRTENGVLNTRKRTGDACMVLYLTDGAAADRDGNINGVVDALIGLAAVVLPH